MFLHIQWLKIFGIFGMLLPPIEKTENTQKKME